MRRATSSLLASGCAFATTACRLPTPSDDPTVLFSAALNRLSDGMKADFGRLDANVQGLRTEVKAELKDVRTQMSAFDASFKAEVKEFRTQMGAFDASFKAEVKEFRTQLNAFDASVKAEMQDVKKSIKSEIQKQVKMNERFLLVVCIAYFVALVYFAELSFGREVKVAHALERSQTASEVLAGAMSGDVFTENVQRAARQKRIEPSL